MKFDSLGKMRIKSSKPKYDLGRPRKGLITSLVLKKNIGPKKRKKARYAITNVSMKDISNMIKQFKNYLIRVVCRRGPNMNPTKVTLPIKKAC